MLPDEIKPVADQQIKALDEVTSDLQSILTSYNGNAVGITAHDIAMDINKLAHVKGAITRFKICMLDEVAQKNRYRDRWLELKGPAAE